MTNPLWLKKKIHSKKTVKNLKWLNFEKYYVEKAGNPSRTSASKK